MCVNEILNKQQSKLKDKKELNRDTDRITTIRITAAQTIITFVITVQ
jgi:hypothetical protein